MPFNDLKKLLKLSRAFKDKYSNLSVAFLIAFISVTFFFFPLQWSITHSV